MTTRLNNTFKLLDVADKFTGPKKLLTVNNGTHGNDYTFPTLVPIYKDMKEKGIDMNIDEFGEKFVTKLKLDPLLDNNNMEINFDGKMINFVLKPNFVQVWMRNFLNSNRIISPTNLKFRILVDYSSPNIAKDIHVGHLRSTIIGDTMCRLFEILGHEVKRVNHIGDFGTQFGMLIQNLYDKYPNFRDQNIKLSELQEFYKQSKKRFDDPNELEFRKKSYQRVVELQQGKSNVINAWNFIKDVSKEAYNEIYNRLEIQGLEEVGESFYQQMIPSVIQELKSKGIIEEEGRQIIKVNSVKGIVLTVMKSDGGYTYDTTDLAAIRYRLVDLNMDQIYYVVDVGQATHFKLYLKLLKWQDG